MLAILLQWLEENNSKGIAKEIDVDENLWQGLKSKNLTENGRDQ